jgi:hypothetical protein
MNGKLDMTCLKYQVYLYGSEAITYLSAFLWVVTEPALWVIRLPPPHTTGSPPPSLYGSITFTHLEENSSMVNYHTFVKKQGENLYGWETITCKTTISKPRV